ncbi:hypothetical protein SAMN04490370_102242 [Eubacterium ruminantium]|nr:hypothetical protein SAMN04490370_102242 [Eubacterium ruminantium]
MIIIILKEIVYKIKMTASKTEYIDKYIYFGKKQIIDI